MAHGLLTPKEQDEMSPKAVIEISQTSAPTAYYAIPEEESIPDESIFHPIKAFSDVLSAIMALTKQVNLLVKQQERERTFKDTPTTIGSTIGYSIAYSERKYLYMFSITALTLNIASGGSVTIPACIWTNVSLLRGDTLTVSGGSDVTPAKVTVRACDVPMFGELDLLANYQTAANATRSNVPAAAGDTLLLAANAARKGATIYNDSSSILYLALGSATSSTTSFTLEVAPGGTYELPPVSMFTGQIRGLWATATGNARITEVS